MPPTMPSRAFDVFSAMAPPPGTENRISTGRSTTSPTAARIMRRGTELMAGAPTGRPKPGRVIVPTPGPARSSEDLSPCLHDTDAVMRAPWVQSGSSPASFTTTHVVGPSASTAKVTRAPPGSATSTSGGGRPVASAMAAALAAAEAQVPVVQPVRRPRAASVVVTPGGPSWCPAASGAGTGGRSRASTGGCARRHASQGRAHQHQHGRRGAGGGEIAGQVADGGDDHLLVGPTGPHDDGRGGVGGVGAGRAQQLGLELGGPGGRQEHGRGGADGGEGGHRFPGGHRGAGPPRQPGDHDALGDLGDGELPPESGPRSGQRADTGDDLEGPPVGTAPVDLLLDGTVEGRVPGVQPHDGGVGVAAYTPSTSSRVMTAESWISAPGRAWAKSASGTSDEAQITMSAAARRCAPRRVMRSAAPGPAPTKEITARGSMRWGDDHRGQIAGRQVGPEAGGRHPLAGEAQQLPDDGVVHPPRVGQGLQDGGQVAAPLVDDDGLVGLRQGRFQRPRTVQRGDQLQPLGPVEEDRAGAGRQVLEGHDARHGPDGGARPDLGHGARQGRERAVDVGIAEGDERHFLALVEAARDGGGRRAVRRQAVDRGARHVEHQSLHPHLGGHLSHDGLGPPDGVGRQRRRHYPIGVPQRPDRLQGHRLGVAGADADADEAPGGLLSLWSGGRRHGSDLRPSWEVQALPGSGRGISGSRRPVGTVDAGREAPDRSGSPARVSVGPNVPDRRVRCRPAQPPMAFSSSGPLWVIISRSWPLAGKFRIAPSNPWSMVSGWCLPPKAIRGAGPREGAAARRTGRSCPSCAT